MENMERKLTGISEWRNGELLLRLSKPARHYRGSKLFITSCSLIVAGTLTAYCSSLLIMAWKAANYLMQSA